MTVKNFVSIGEAELEVMKVIWRAKSAISSPEICKAVENHGWKRTTVMTFLARLAEKGVISAEKCGKTMYYTPIMTAKEYKKTQVKNLLKNVFDGSAKALVASLFEQENLSDNEIAELKAIFDNKE